jgi:hypothetical protein
MSEERHCRECVNAEWERTPTGRIRKKYCGNCSKASDLMAYYSHERFAPCISVGSAHILHIWPHYDASGCPMYRREEAVTKKEKK